MTVIAPAPDSSPHSTQAIAPSRARFPASGGLGLTFIAVGWVTAWLPMHPLSAGSFVLLWFGFVLVVDGLVYLRRGDSILHATPGKFAQLFVFSVPFWWLFEALNARVQNWHYVLDHPYGLTWSPLAYNLMATLCFSTVLPAVMEIAALLTSFAPLCPRLARGLAEPAVPRGLLLGEGIGGILAIVLPLLWPHYFFGLIWVGPLLLLDAWNAAFRQRSAMAHLLGSDWQFVAALALAALICGGFWEMWNYWSLPKWQYEIPFVGFAKVFEMPILGYLGYLPFGVELFALYQFLLGLTRQQDDALPF